MGRVICHMAKRMANVMANGWQHPVLPSRLDSSSNVRTYGRTNGDTNTGKISSSSVSNAGEHDLDFSVEVRRADA